MSPESLGGNAKLAMICAISPAQSCKSETFSTLRFAQRAKAIKNKAVVNEVTENDVKAMRELIRQLKDELQRIKSNGGYSTGWDARRSLNLLRLSLNRPAALACIEGDSDEEMEIDEEDVEKLSLQAGMQQVPFMENVQLESLACKKSKAKDLSTSTSGGDQDFEEVDVNMEDCHPQMASDCLDENTGRDGHEDCHPQMASDCLDENTGRDGHEEAAAKDPDFPGPETVNHLVHEDDVNQNNLNGTSGGFGRDTTEERLLLLPADCGVLKGGLIDKPVEETVSTCIELVEEKPCTVDIESKPPSIGDSSQSSPTNLRIKSIEPLPVLKSPTSSISPKIFSNSRKSLSTSLTLTASGRDVKEGIKSLRNSSTTLPNEVMTNSPAPTQNLAASLHHGLQIIESHQRNSALRRSSFRFSYNPLDIQPFSFVEKVDVGVQTLQQEQEIKEDSSEFICSYCKRKMPKLECEEANMTSELQLVPVEELQVGEKPKNQVPKAVEKVLAGAIRREMALEECCIKQAAKITQLNRLVQQYKHERECNAIIAQTREDKICRLEGFMDGVLPVEDFMEEEFVSLTIEHKLLKEKYENHPEVLRTNIELKRVQEELERYQNFLDMGERDVLMEEIQDLRTQLQYYVDSSPMQSRKQRPLIQLTYQSEPVSGPLNTIPESTEETSAEKIEEERRLWNEIESKWISLSEELRLELEASRSLAEKQKHELDSEKKCSEELKQALQMAMQGHARILEQYADLQEKHMALLARHRKITDGIEDVKRAAAKAGVKGAESKFLNSLAAEISALKVEREKERRYFRDENKGLQTQLRDTAEAVQAAGELLVRLKEAEEAAAAAQNRVILAEQVAEKARQEIDELKKKHETEINILKQFQADARLPKEARRPAYDDDVHMPTNYDGGDTNEEWRQEFEPFYENKFSRTAAETSSWFTGRDSNISSRSVASLIPGKYNPKENSLLPILQLGGHGQSLQDRPQRWFNMWHERQSLGN
ncbi:TRAFAC class myosin-kinesin ATPase superfamily, partial [Asimina triloba]